MREVLVFSQTDNPWFCYIVIDIVIHIDNLLDEIWKLMNSVSYVSQQRGHPLLSAFEIFLKNSCLLVLRGVWCLDTHAFSPGPSLGRFRWSFLLLWLWQVIIRYHDKSLILPNFLLMKTIQEVDFWNYIGSV